MLLNPCCLMVKLSHLCNKHYSLINKLINKATLNGVKIILNLNSCNEKFSKRSEIICLKYGQYKIINGTWQHYW